MPDASPFSCRWRLRSGSGADLEAPGDAALEVSADAVAVSPAAGPPFRVDFAEVDEQIDGDFAVSFTLADGSRAEFSQLGRRCDEFRRAAGLALRAYRLRNLLLEEPVGGEAFGGRVEAPEAVGHAEVRVYATSLAVLPAAGVPFGIPFGEVGAVGFEPASYRVTIPRRGREPVGLSQLGRATDAFRRLLDERLGALRRRHAEALAFLAPTAGASVLRRLADLMPDGVPARKADVDAISRDLWPLLVRNAAGTAALAETLARLIERSVPDEVAVGVKETNARQDAAPEDADEGGDLAPSEGPLAGRVAWFLCPVAASNAVAVEAASRGGRATYVFRALPEAEHRAASEAVRSERLRHRVREISRALVALSFKREPIYLADEKLASGAYARYQLALRLLPYLGATRAAFVGRAIHGEGWATQLEAAFERARSGGPAAPPAPLTGG